MDLWSVGCSLLGVPMWVCVYVALNELPVGNNYGVVGSIPTLSPSENVHTGFILERCYFRS